MKYPTFSALFLLLATAPVFGGVVYEIEVTDHSGYSGGPSVETMETKIEGKNLAMTIASGEHRGKGDMIFRGDRREMVAVDHDDQTYVLIDEAAIQQLAGHLSGMDAQIQQALKDVPADQRAMVEAMMKQRMPQQMQAPAKPITKLKRTSERGTQNGYPCVKYEVLRDGQKIRELWVTDWGNVEGGSEVVGAFEEMSAFFKELKNAMPSFGQGDDDNPFEYMKELDGFPVVTREFGDDGSLESESALRSSRRQTIDPDAFDPPSGYKRQEMFGG